MDIKALSKVNDSLSRKSSNEERRKKISDALARVRKRREVEHARAIRDARRAAAISRRKREIRDSRSAGSSRAVRRVKLSDSFKSMKRRIKDELSETESTEDAAQVAIDALQDAPAEVVITAVTEVLGDVIDKLSDEDLDDDNYEEEGYEEEEVSDSRRSKRKPSKVSDSKQLKSAYDKLSSLCKKFKFEVDDFDYAQDTFDDSEGERFQVTAYCKSSNADKFDDFCDAAEDLGFDCNVSTAASKSDPKKDGEVTLTYNFEVSDSAKRKPLKKKNFKVSDSDKRLLSLVKGLVKNSNANSLDKAKNFADQISQKYSVTINIDEDELEIDGYDISSMESDIQIPFALAAITGQPEYSESDFSTKAIDDYDANLDDYRDAVFQADEDLTAFDYSWGSSDPTEILVIKGLYPNLENANPVKKGEYFWVSGEFNEVRGIFDNFDEFLDGIKSAGYVDEDYDEVSDSTKRRAFKKHKKVSDSSAKNVEELKGLVEDRLIDGETNFEVEVSFKADGCKSAIEETVSDQGKKLVFYDYDKDNKTVEVRVEEES